MFKKFCLTVVLVLSTVVNALPPEWPAEYGDRDIVHRRLREIEDILETRMKAKQNILSLRSSFTESRHPELFKAIGQIVGLSDKDQKAITLNLKNQHKDYVISLLTDALAAEITTYSNMLGYCKDALREDGNSVFGFFYLLWHSKEQYFAEVQDLIKRNRGVNSMLSQLGVKEYLESDNAVYKDISSSLIGFVESSITGNAKAAMNAKRNNIKSFVKPVKAELETQYKLVLNIIVKTGEHVRSKGYKVLGQENFMRMTNLTMPYEDEFTKKLEDRGKVVSRPDILAFSAASQAFERMLRPYCEMINKYNDEVERNKKEKKLEEGLTDDYGSADPESSSFSLLKYARLMGIKEKDFEKISGNGAAAASASGTVAAAGPGERYDSSSDDSSSSDEEEW